MIVQALQQFHSDQDIPPNAVWMKKCLVIIIAYDVGITAQGIHDPDLGFQVFNDVSLIQPLLTAAARSERNDF